MAATRGEFGVALYQALGIETPSSTDKFSDAGIFAGVFSTLQDLGITTGVGGGKYGGGTAITRGQAFTMMARALGLATTDTSIEEASQALVDAGIVRGYGGNVSNLGLNDPLESNHLSELVGRMAPELEAVTDEASGATVGSNILDTVADTAQQAQAVTDPAFAAFLQQQGINLDRVQENITTRQGLYEQDALRRSESYSKNMLDAERGISTDFENRGLTRSGARGQSVARSNESIGDRQETESYNAQRAKERADRLDYRTKNDLLRAGATSEMDSDIGYEYDEAGEEY